MGTGGSGERGERDRGGGGLIGGFGGGGNWGNGERGIGGEGRKRGGGMRGGKDQKTSFPPCSPLLSQRNPFLGKGESFDDKHAQIFFFKKKGKTGCGMKGEERKRKRGDTKRKGGGA